MKARELKTVWRLVADTGFEHPHSDQLRLALLVFAFRKKCEVESGVGVEADEPAASATPKSEALTLKTAPSQSFQQASRPVSEKLAASYSQMEELSSGEH